MLMMALVVLRVITSVPVPVNDTVCVLPFTPLSLSVTMMAPVRVPVVVGVNETSKVQLLSAAREETHRLFEMA